MKQKGLGRGLDAIFGSDPVDFTQVQVEFVISAISSMVMSSPKWPQ